MKGSNTSEFNLKALMRGINIILFGFLLFDISACTNKNEVQDCSKLRTGEFEYKGRINKRSLGIINIKRNDSIQTEIVEQTGATMQFKIEWKGDCRYTLKTIAVSINGKDTVPDVSTIPLVTTEIKKVTKNYYICESRNDKTDKVFTDTIVILKLAGN